MPVVDTERDGWTRVGTLGWRKSLRDRHWAQVERGQLGWDWTIYRADPVTMCPYSPASGTDISLSAVKDAVDEWNDGYHAHAIVARRERSGWWTYYCRYCHRWGLGTHTFDAIPGKAAQQHTECEAKWQRGWR